MFKAKLVTLLGALVIAGSSFALQKPIVCPSIGAAQAEGMTLVSEILEGMYLTYHQSQFDTSSTWIFIMGPVMAENEEIALETSNQYLSTMSTTAEPQQDEDGVWVCEYQESGVGEFTVFAIQSEDSFSPFKLNRYLKRH